jgi:hypothetical protein
VYNSVAGVQLDNAFSGKIQHLFSQVPDIEGARALQVLGRGTSPIVSHATLIGSSEDATQVLHLSDGTGGVFVNMLLVHYQGIGIYHECTALSNVTQPVSSSSGDDVVAPFDHAKLVVLPQENTVWNPLDNSSERGPRLQSVGCSPSQTIDESKLRAGAGANPNLIALPQSLETWITQRSRVIDLRPAPGSSLFDVDLTDASIYEPEGSESFFDVVDHVGAFGRADLWISGLSALDSELKVIPDTETAPSLVLCGEINGAMVIPSGSHVIVTCSVVISGSLKIEDDVVIRVMPNDMSANAYVPFVLVRSSGSLEMLGHALRPITITTAMNQDYIRDIQAQGLWGGVVILGDALVSKAPRSFNSTALSPHFGGITGVSYGSNVEAGFPAGSAASTLKHTRIWHAGSELGPGGLVLAGQGSETTIQYVEVAWSAGVGLGLLGGAPSVGFVSVLMNHGRGIVAAQGYRGVIEHAFVIAYQAPALEMQSDKHSTNGTAGWMQTRASVARTTLLGYELVNRGDGMEDGKLESIK